MDIHYNWKIFQSARVERYDHHPEPILEHIVTILSNYTIHTGKHINGNFD